MTLEKVSNPSSGSFRIPNCFLLIGGIIAALSVLGLLLVKEPSRGEKTEQKQLLDDSELPSLDAKEVLRTALFYKVALFFHKQLRTISLFISDLVRFLLSLWNSGIYLIEDLILILSPTFQSLLVTWQKSFGLKMIDSDRFHADIGIASNFCNGVLIIKLHRP